MKWLSFKRRKYFKKSNAETCDARSGKSERKNRKLTSVNTNLLTLGFKDENWKMMCANRKWDRARLKSLRGIRLTNTIYLSLLPSKVSLESHSVRSKVKTFESGWPAKTVFMGVIRLIQGETALDSKARSWVTWTPKTRSCLKEVERQQCILQRTCSLPRVMSICIVAP